jgi:hypothetical protein
MEEKHESVTQMEISKPKFCQQKYQNRYGATAPRTFSRRQNAVRATAV